MAAYVREQYREGVDALLDLGSRTPDVSVLALAALPHAPVLVTVKVDTVPQPDETLFVEFSSAVNAGVADGDVLDEPDTRCPRPRASAGYIPLLFILAAIGVAYGRSCAGWP